MLAKDYLKDIQRSWDTYGKEDPMWAILTDPNKSNNRWDEGEFFQSGRGVASAVMAKADGLGHPRVKKTFLDFGCGIGRLTQGFATHFQQSIGIDIAPSMIARARECNKHGPRVTYLLNEANDLSRFKSDSIDMIYTEHVLQHMHPIVSRKYIQEMLRVLSPGGLLAFHVPSELARFVYPDDGLAASIAIGKEFLSAAAGSTVLVPLTVTNTGAHSWLVESTPGRSRTPVRVINHWFNIGENGWTSVRHGYHTIPTTMHPGDVLELEYKLHMPSASGHYMAIFDVADFNRVTFHERGGTVATIEAVVKGDAIREDQAAQGEAREEYKPRMEMHAIHSDEVTRIITGGGGRMLDIETRERTPDEHAWTRYFVTK